MLMLTPLRDVCYAADVAVTACRLIHADISAAMPLTPLFFSYAYADAFITRFDADAAAYATDITLLLMLFASVYLPALLFFHADSYAFRLFHALIAAADAAFTLP